MGGHVDINVENGTLRGKIYGDGSGNVDYYSFTGVPYAKPPIGELRFAESQPFPKWDGILDVANNDSASFIQYGRKTTQVIGTEELVLNVYTPALPKDGACLKSVIVYIHEGGFLWGSGCKDLYGPDFLVKKDVVFVAVNYRLGAFGFLCLDIKECPGNMGLKDQTLALKWVKDNIAYFNGDNKNVTIMGTSAGAASVNYHLLSKASEGLFHKAIIHSGNALAQWALCRNPLDRAKSLATILEIKSTDPHVILEKLKDMTANDIVNATLKMSSDRYGLFLPFTPILEKKFDGVTSFIQEEPLNLLKQELVNNVPTIIGFCESEELMVADVLPILFEEKYSKTPEKAVEILTPVQSTILREMIYKTYKNKGEDFYVRFQGDLDFNAGAYKVASLLSRNNKHVYTYQFNYVGKFNLYNYLENVNPPIERPTHLDDLGYLISAKCLPVYSELEQDHLVRERMTMMWTNFAKFGNPTPTVEKVLPIKWLPTTENEYRALNITDTLEMLVNPFEERRLFWDYLYDEIFSK